MLPAFPWHVFTLRSILHFQQRLVSAPTRATVELIQNCFCLANVVKPSVMLSVSSAGSMYCLQSCFSAKAGTSSGFTQVEKSLPRPGSHARLTV